MGRQGDAPARDSKAFDHKRPGRAASSVGGKKTPTLAHTHTKGPFSNRFASDIMLPASFQLPALLFLRVFFDYFVMMHKNESSTF
jgi:hypothetical protein